MKSCWKAEIGWGSKTVKGSVITREQDKWRTCLVVTVREGLSRQYKHWDMYLFKNSLENVAEIGAVLAMRALAQVPSVRQRRAAKKRSN